MSNKLEQKIYSFSARIADFEKVNSQFAKVKVYVLYTGRNRNYSDMSKQVIENALYSLRNIPVVGEWKEENNNFGGHGGKLEISDEGINWIETTKPYGVVPSDTEIKWEMVREKDGLTEHEYLTCTAYLWHQRYPEIEKILNDGANQSMEINVPKYHFDEEGYTVFDEIEFSALCILGKDSDPEKNVEPCFEGAKVTNYSLNKDQFKQEFTKMLKELKYSLQDQSSFEGDIQNSEEGGIEVEGNEVNIEAEVAEQPEEFTEAVEPTEVADNDVQNESETFEDSHQESQEFQESQESQEVEESQEAEEEFKDKEDNKDPDVDTMVDETMQEMMDNMTKEMESTKKKMKEQMKGKSKMSLDNDSSDLESAKTQFEALQLEYNSLQEEVVTLREFKANVEAKERQEQEEALFSQFKDLEGNEEFEQLKAKAHDFSLEQLEKEVAFIMVKNNANFKFSAKPQVKKDKVKIEFNKKEEEESPSEFGELFKKYLKK